MSKEAESSGLKGSKKYVNAAVLERKKAASDDNIVVSLHPADTMGKLQLFCGDTLLNKLKLRGRLADLQTMVIALGQAAVYSEKQSAPLSQAQSSLDEAAKLINQVYSVLPNYDVVCKLSETCSFILGIPIGPILATKGVSEILDKFRDTKSFCEYKYDGEHAQINYLENGSVEIYSRNAERNSGKFTNVVSSVERGKGKLAIQRFLTVTVECKLKKSSVRSLVLDCKVFAYDRDEQKPFQSRGPSQKEGRVQWNQTTGEDSRIWTRNPRSRRVRGTAEWKPLDEGTDGGLRVR
ncbi:hypothetical protein IFM89_012954 [Coptis chinensis]|uniref:ATP-dependent DNA ligase family profile domain-containing protein n=1 Tax=Coptis chinensis TaxID=261450 RepID=A0A835HVC1_9MAGN|nr:hypothetical protein IFM89_012954 [Coptis chinensis]